MGRKRDLKKKMAKERANRVPLMPALYRPIYDPSQQGYYIEAHDDHGQPIYFGNVYGKLNLAINEFKMWASQHQYIPTEHSRSYA